MTIFTTVIFIELLDVPGFTSNNNLTGLTLLRVQIKIIII